MHTNYGYFNEKYLSDWEKQIQLLQEKFSSSIFKAYLPKGAGVAVDEVIGSTDLPVVILKKESYFEILQFCKNELHYDFLTDITATDELENPSDLKERFFLVIHLFSTATKLRIRIKCPLQENETLPTLIPLWSGANWAEREVFDMYGIRFDGHPDLRRILMDQRFEGYPLRKDYPLRGYQVFLTPEPINEDLLK